jgi:hypothetical protein
MHTGIEHIQDIFNNVITIQQTYVERFAQYQEARVNNAFDFSHQYLNHSIETLKDIHLKLLEDRSILKTFTSAPLIQTIIDSSCHLRLKMSHYQKGFNAYKGTMRSLVNRPNNKLSSESQDTPYSVKQAFA